MTVEQQGIIGIENLKIDCIIGIKPEERSREQEIYIDMKVETDISRCVATDAVTDTVDYVHLSELCKSIAKRGKFRLLEAYAHAVLERVFRDYPVSWAWICVKKPMQLPWAKYTTVELQRRKDEG